ncbi:conserved hypothetical protein [Pyrobaculum islandicum DSM 4184]|uniref:Uncharacterized protein n=1 Tax=Pyrobaculum islandicum (strain DSM 4184 / JCM 9189 / GEO3) TaxID=384616 RepID=A1RV64_PYRIL|nr:hypothetical protein [Pyrobaculum islandicum]ABL88846.1 conserved hypothetical protein [Pyrobaculum islandicum DSM 4184]
MRFLAFTLLVVVLVILSALSPVEYLISDALRPPPNKILTNEGVKAINSIPIWLYFWRITVVLTVLFFSAVVATFFLKPNIRVRWTLAVLSILIAVFHYLTLLFTSSPPGSGVSIYPLFYIISVKEASQIYLDIGQLLILYAVYNIYLAKQKRKATSRISLLKT